MTACLFVIPFVVTAIMVMISWRLLKQTSRNLTKLAVINICTDFILTVILFGGVSAIADCTVFKLVTVSAVSFVTAVISLYVLILKWAKAKSVLSYIALALFVCVFLEFTLFNLNFYKSYDYKAESVADILSKSELYVVKNDTIELYNIDRHIDNIYIKLDSYNDLEEAVIADVQIDFTDAANKLFKSAPKRTINNFYSRDQYINTNFSGNTQNLVLTFNVQGSVSGFRIDDIVINANRPFEFNYLRFVVLLGISVLLCFVMRYRSVFDKKLVENRSTVFNIIAVCFILQSVLIIAFGSLNPAFSNIYRSEDPDSAIGLELDEFAFGHHNQYDQLAQSFLNGRLYLKDVPPKALVDMDNPYDLAYREFIMKSEKTSARWDVAYYNGRYYVYFGVVPVLLLYLPFRILTANPFPTNFGVMGFCILFSLGAYILIRKIAERYFRQTTIGTYLLTAITAVNCCGMMFIAKRPDFYSLPIIMGLTFSVWGIYNWIRATEEGTNTKLHLFIGALFMALVAGCRPQLVLISFFALPIFYGKYIKDKRLFHKDGLKELVVFAVPYIVVAAGLMTYNYLRFDSPFDFGANYNLTSNDMTNRGFNLSRIGLAIFTYFFQTPSFNAKFPYLISSPFETNYVGTTIRENCFGGIFACYPMLWFLLFIRRVKDTLKEKGLFIPLIMLCVMGICIGVLDAQMAGILQRYYSDFSFLIFTAAILVVFALSDQMKNGVERKYLNNFLGFAFTLGLVYTFLIIFSVSDVTINTTNPQVFYAVSNMIEFWL